MTLLPFPLLVNKSIFLKKIMKIAAMHDIVFCDLENVICVDKST